MHRGLGLRPGSVCGWRVAGRPEVEVPERGSEDRVSRAVGVDIGGTQLRAAVVDAEGHILDRRRARTPAGTTEGLVNVLGPLLRELSGGRLPVGVGIAGLVTDTGVVRYGPNIGVRDLDLRSALAPVTDGPVVVVNDASAATFGEQRFGAGRGAADLVLLTIGTGVGGGIVIGGELVLGRRGFAGELGHMVVAEGGRTCPCGNRGCLEAYASGTAIGAMAREQLVDLTARSSLRGVADPSGPDVTAAAEAGDAFAQRILEEAGRWLGVAAASLANALDPERILVGGGAAGPTAPWLLPATRASLADHLMGGAWRPAPPVELASLGDDAGVVGAAALAAARDRRPEGAP